MSMVQVMDFASPPVQEREIYRYAGCREADEGVRALLQACLEEAEKVLQYRVCWLQAACRTEKGVCDFGAFSVASEDLSKNLQGCKAAVLFAATVGMGLDRLIARYQKLSPAKAVMLQAIGAERAESLCDAFCDWLQQQSKKLRPRFSPGYGDVPLSVQKDFFALLQCEKNMGLYLNESLLMSPSKSVTAFIGVEGE